MEEYLWVKTLGPAGQLLLLCPEDLLLQSLVEGPHAGACQLQAHGHERSGQGGRKALTFEDTKTNSIESKLILIIMVTYQGIN